jgi:hypothetical protein
MIAASDIDFVAREAAGSVDNLRPGATCGRPGYWHIGCRRPERACRRCFTTLDAILVSPLLMQPAFSFHSSSLTWSILRWVDSPVYPTPCIPMPAVLLCRVLGVAPVPSEAKHKVRPSVLPCELQRPTRLQRMGWNLAPCVNPAFVRLPCSRD